MASSILGQFNWSDIQPINVENLDIGHYYFQYSVNYDSDMAQTWGAIVKVENIDHDGIWITNCIITRKQPSGEWSAWTEQEPSQKFLSFTGILPFGTTPQINMSYTRLYSPKYVD